MKPQEQVHEHVAEEIRVPVPRVTEKMIDVVKHTPREWLQSHTVEQNVAVQIPRVTEDILEAVERTPQEHAHSCTWEQLVDVPDSQIHEEIVQQNKTFHVIKRDLVKKFLDMFAELAELSDDVKEFFEQLGKCFKIGVHDNSTVGAKIAELLRPNVSASNGEQVVDVPDDMQRL